LDESGSLALSVLLVDDVFFESLGDIPCATVVLSAHALLEGLEILAAAAVC
jgi:hypothetical protein